MHILMASDTASDALRHFITSTGLVQKLQAFTPAAQTVYVTFFFKSNMGITLLITGKTVTEDVLNIDQRFEPSC